MTNTSEYNLKYFNGYVRYLEDLNYSKQDICKLEMYHGSISSLVHKYKNNINVGGFRQIVGDYVKFIDGLHANELLIDEKVAFILLNCGVCNNESADILCRYIIYKCPSNTCHPFPMTKRWKEIFTNENYVKYDTALDRLFTCICEEYCELYKGACMPKSCVDTVFSMYIDYGIQSTIGMKQIYCKLNDKDKRLLLTRIMAMTNIDGLFIDLIENTPYDTINNVLCVETIYSRFEGSTLLLSGRRMNPNDKNDRYHVDKIMKVTENIGSDEIYDKVLDMIKCIAALGIVLLSPYIVQMILSN